MKCGCDIKLIYITICIDKHEKFNALISMSSLHFFGYI